MKVFTRDKEFYRDFLRIFIVLVLQNVVSLSVNLADNLMLGGYSEAALSGVAAVNQVQFLLQQVMLGVGDGMVILASQYWGKKEMEPIYKVGAIAIRFGLLIIAGLFLVVSIWPTGVMHLFTNEVEIVEQGVEYLEIIRFTYLFFGMTSILLAALRTVETVKIAFYLSISTLIINCSINYCLIYGHFGAPRMGARGAAIGTLVARMVEFVIILVYIKWKEQNYKLRIRDLLSVDRKLSRDYFKYSTPIIVVCILWGCSTGLQTVILGHMTASAIAANSIACTLFMILKASTSGAASSAGVLTGRTIGRGDQKKVQEYAVTMQVIFLMIGLCTSILLLLLKGPVLSLYDVSAKTKAMANSFLLVLSVTCIGSAYENPTITGILRAGGNTRFDMITDLISIWGIVLPVSFLAAFVFKQPPVVVVACLNIDQVLKCIPAFIKVNRCHWIRNLTV